jgi:hypothetical protein
MGLLYIKSLDVPRIGVTCYEMDVQASRLQVRKKALSYAFELHAINGFDLSKLASASKARTMIFSPRSFSGTISIGETDQTLRSAARS